MYHYSLSPGSPESSFEGSCVSSAMTSTSSEFAPALASAFNPIPLINSSTLSVKPAMVELSTINSTI